MFYPFFFWIWGQRGMAWNCASAQESHGSVADGVRVLGEGPLRILGGQCSTMPYKTLKSKDKSLKRVFNHVLWLLCHSDMNFDLIYIYIYTYIHIYIHIQYIYIYIFHSRQSGCFTSKHRGWCESHSGKMRHLLWGVEVTWLRRETNRPWPPLPCSIFRLEKRPSLTNIRCGLCDVPMDLWSTNNGTQTSGSIWKQLETSGDIWKPWCSDTFWHLFASFLRDQRTIAHRQSTQGEAVTSPTERGVARRFVKFHMSKLFRATEALCPFEFHQMRQMRSWWFCQFKKEKPADVCEALWNGSDSTSLQWHHTCGLYRIQYPDIDIGLIHRPKICGRFRLCWKLGCTWPVDHSPWPLAAASYSDSASPATARSELCCLGVQQSGASAIGWLGRNCRPGGAFFAASKPGMATYGNCMATKCRCWVWRWAKWTPPISSRGFGWSWPSASTGAGIFCDVRFFLNWIGGNYPKIAELFRFVNCCNLSRIPSRLLFWVCQGGGWCHKHRILRSFFGVFVLAPLPQGLGCSCQLADCSKHHGTLGCWTMGSWGPW